MTAFHRLAPAFGMLVALSSVTVHAQTNSIEKILVSTPKPYDRISSAIRAHGGRVTHEFKYVDAIAAEIPVNSLAAIRRLAGPTSMSRDALVPHPKTSGPARARKLTGQQTAAVAVAQASSAAIDDSVIPSYAAAHPGAYALNTPGTRIEQLHARGFTGKGTTVAIIDSGMRPGFSSLQGSLAGGIDFVDDGPVGPAGDTANDWLKNGNDGHGTFAAGLISGSGIFNPSKGLKDALTRYAPHVLDSGKLPLIGTAPDSKIYSVRVFGDVALQGARLSIILASIQHVIDLRDEWNRSGGRYGLKIDVCNVSFGTSTIHAGRSLLERSLDSMLAVGIIPVVSTGNTGPSPLTIASPGSSMSAIGVGGTTQATNERILYDIAGSADLGFEPTDGLGGYLRPFSGTPASWFSSRGPTADGRIDPDVVASSVANFGEGYCPNQEMDACSGKISLVSGTSFSAPIVAGIAAALRDAFPSATATAIRNAIIASARTSPVDSGATEIDRGRGLVDALGAFDLLASGKAGNTLPPENVPDDEVRRNVERNTSLVVNSGWVRRTVNGLRPGAHSEILFEVLPGTERVVVQVKNVRFSDNQNLLIGDALFIDVHSAKTSSIGAFGDYLLPGHAMFEGDEEEFVFNDPDTGIVRVTVSGDTLNAGPVSAEVTVYSIREALPRVTFQGTIRDEETREFQVRIPAGTQKAEFLLTWEKAWGSYPTSDVDLILFPPNSTVANRTGATLAGPERVSIPSPPAGDWRVLIDGFDIPDGADDFQLRIALDGVILR